ncbi:MAG: hypothetical protein QM775_30050 [Pirellulales bacterium]
MFHLMRSVSACALAAAMMTGCSQESTSTKETKVTGPGGETKVTQETKVETSGKNPPPVSP